MSRVNSALALEDAVKRCGLPLTIYLVPGLEDGGPGGNSTLQDRHLKVQFNDVADALAFLDALPALVKDWWAYRQRSETF